MSVPPPHALTLHPLDGAYAVCRLAPIAAVPPWAVGTFVSITRTPDELSVICPQAAVPADVRHEGGFRLLRIGGTFGFDVVGVMAAASAPLAAAVSAFCPSPPSTPTTC